jgi:hypothetical protein
MRTIEIKEINVSTKQGRLDWLEYKAKDDWTYLAETGMVVMFERITEEVSNCCNAKLINESDVCSKCNEHSKKINI